MFDLRPQPPSTHAHCCCRDHQNSSREAVTSEKCVASNNSTRHSPPGSSADARRRFSRTTNRAAAVCFSRTSVSERLLVTCLLLLALATHHAADTTVCVVDTTNNTSVTRVWKDFCNSTKGCSHVQLTNTSTTPLRFEFCHLSPALTLNSSTTRLNDSHPLTSTTLYPARIPCSELRRLSEKDASLASEFEEFVGAFSQFTCRTDKTSGLTRLCGQCQLAYKDWLCSTQFPVYLNSIPQLECKQATENVCYACPEFAVGDDSDYMGQPAFECHTENDNDNHHHQHRSIHNNNTAFCEYLLAGTSSITSGL